MINTTENELLHNNNKTNQESQMKQSEINNNNNTTTHILNSSNQIRQRSNKNVVTLNLHKNNKSVYDTQKHDNNLNILSFNAQTNETQVFEDLLQLMADTKTHIIALQDTGVIHEQTKLKQFFGDYQIIKFRFAENRNDTLAFIIEEGIYHKFLNNTKIFKNEKARAMGITIPNATNKKDLILVNTYAPPQIELQKEYQKSPTFFKRKQLYTRKHNYLWRSK